MPGLFSEAQCWFSPEQRHWPGQGTPASLGGRALPKPSASSRILSSDLMGFGSGPKHFLICSNTLLNFEFNSAFLRTSLFIT